MTPVEIGPLQRSTGVAYVHDLALDGDENLSIGTLVNIADGGGEHLSATVTHIEQTERGNLYQLTLDLPSAGPVHAGSMRADEPVDKAYTNGVAS